MKPIRSPWTPVALWLALGSWSTRADLPSTYDLRDVDGVSYVTSIKSQLEGTCWTHGAMAAIEGNLLMTGAWAAEAEEGQPNLAEYHLDWWNGFNWNCNDDVPWPPHGLEPHQGGDYLVTAAYLTRAEGAVREDDAPQFYTPSARQRPSYHHYYVPQIEWYVAGEDLESINTIKQAVIDYGVVGTALCSNSSFMGTGYIHYQPPDNPLDPNHAVAIVGWDDDKVTPAPAPGAWLCKNSWGTAWGFAGYFWISYYDKHAGQHPEMGAVSFQDVELLPYDHIYYHDYHGWRDTKTDCTEAFNAFVTTSLQRLEAVSFYTAAEDVTYTAIVYDRFSEGELSDELAVQTGTIAHRGFHTIALDTPVILGLNEDFYVYVELSHGGHAFDRTSEIPVLLGASARTVVQSISHPNESFYHDGSTWRDLYDYEVPGWPTGTANFCLKALTTDYHPVYLSYPDDRPAYLLPTTPNTITVKITDGHENYVPGSGLLHYHYDGGDFLTVPLVPLGDDRYAATLPAASCDATPEYFLTAEGDGGTTVWDPPAAPDERFTAIVGTLTVLLDDDFETDQGWTVQDVEPVTASWERGIPFGGGTRLDPPTDADGSGQCFITGNSPWLDVDGGPTRLLSPALDLTAVGQFTIRYARWFWSGNGIWDELTVEISNDDGASWTTVEIVESGSDWFVHVFVVSDFVTPTGQVRLRFSAEDDEFDSVTEAGLDSFLVTHFICEPTYIPGDCNCDSHVDFFDIDAFVLVLNNPDGYSAAYPDCNPLNADCNEDGTVDFFDIDGFVELISG